MTSILLKEKSLQVLREEIRSSNLYEQPPNSHIVVRQLIKIDCPEKNRFLKMPRRLVEKKDLWSCFSPSVVTNLTEGKG